MYLVIFVSAPLASSPVWGRDFSSPEELITEFCRECRIVRKGNCWCKKLFWNISRNSISISISFVGLAGDLKKAMKDGKPIIIEVLFVLHKLHNVFLCLLICHA